MDLPPSNQPAIDPATPALLRPGEKGVRALGWLLLAIGLFLTVATAIIALTIGNTIAHNSAPGAHSHWRGTPEFTATVFKLFGTLFLFGLAAALAGIYQIGTGRRSPVLVGILLLLLLGMVYFGFSILTTAQSSVP